MENQIEDKRQQLIASLSHLGIRDTHVLDALSATSREYFLDDSLQTTAYENHALAIGFGQTISQPLMVAVMTQALHLQGSERVLEIGTGSGYQTAILAQLAAHVYTVERIQQLAYQAARRFQSLNYPNISLFIGDGSLGWLDQAPYDRILVTAASPIVPEHLICQLVPGGILVVPVGARQRQELLLIRRTHTQPEIHSLGNCVFVPLIGRNGWQESV
jgi:protein-L-isoaspartate(D-aspartate) O-methyltransferase